MKDLLSKPKFYNDPKSSTIEQLHIHYFMQDAGLSHH